MDHVYTNDVDPFFDPSPDRLVAGKRFRLPNSSCSPITGFSAGHRYIVSALAVSSAGPISETTAAWELVGQDARFVHMYDSERDLPLSLVRANTLAEVVRLVAPGAELPPTDSKQSVDVQQTGAVLPSAMLSSAFALGLLVWIQLARRTDRQRSRTR